MYQASQNEKVSSASQPISTRSPDNLAYIPIDIPDKASLIRVKTQQWVDDKTPSTNPTPKETTSTRAPDNLYLQDSDYPDITKNDLVDPNFHLALNFKQTMCPKKDVVKLACTGLQCGIRPQALSNRAR